MGNGNISLDDITDITLLKSYAYDEIVKQEQSSRNLTLINQRISVIMMEENKKQEQKIATTTNIRKRSHPTEAPDQSDS